VFIRHDDVRVILIFSVLILKVVIIFLKVWQYTSYKNMRISSVQGDWHFRATQGRKRVMLGLFPLTPCAYGTKLSMRL
jgi:hypothetical protein